MRRGTRARGTRAGGGLPSAPSSGCRRCRLTGKGVFTRERPECSRNLPPPRYAELLTEHVAVGFRRPRRDTEALANLLVRAAERDEHDHLALPIGQGELGAVRALLHGHDATPSARAEPSADGSIRR